MRIDLAFGVALAVLSASPADALQVAVISDLNGSYGSTDYQSDVADAVAAIIDLGPDLVLVTGDMVAGQRKPALSEPEIRAMWQAFHAVVTDSLDTAGIPVAITPGNHDASAYTGFEKERKIYGEEWRARRPDVAFAGLDGYPFFYAFDLDGVRFVSLDVTTVGPLDATQMSGLDKAVNGAGPLRIAFSHLPLWEFAQDRETEIIGDPALAEQFDALGVDLHLSGHHHAFYPGASDGIAYVSQACLGASPRRLINVEQRGPRGFTLLDIDVEAGKIEVGFRAAPGFDQTFDMTELPERIEGFDATLLRIDLADLPTVLLEKPE